MKPLEVSLVIVEPKFIIIMWTWNYQTSCIRTWIFDFTRVVRYVMCIVPQRDNALHDSNNIYTPGYVLIPCKRYKHEPSTTHAYEIIVISIEPVVDCCKNGWETG